MTDEWKEAVLDELVVGHILTEEHYSNPRKAIHDAISWNVVISLDPAVSWPAQKLINDALYKVCVDLSGSGLPDDILDKVVPYVAKHIVRQDSLCANLDDPFSE